MQCSARVARHALHIRPNPQPSTPNPQPARHIAQHTAPSGVRPQPPQAIPLHDDAGCRRHGGHAAHPAAAGALPLTPHTALCTTVLTLLLQPSTPLLPVLLDMDMYPPPTPIAPPPTPLTPPPSPSCPSTPAPTSTNTRVAAGRAALSYLLTSPASLAPSRRLRGDM